MEAERAYLNEVAARLQDVLGDDLVGVYAGGSYALGGYERGRSDLDVAVVVRRTLSDDRLNHVVGALRHEALPVPARKLELVIYTSDVARGGSVEAGFELNLNTGSAEFRADREAQAGERHWFAIDRSVLATNGVALVGPPAADVFAAPPPEALVPLLVDLLRWFQSNEPETDAALLNAGRAVIYAREGVWVPKPSVREWAESQAGPRREILERAIEELARA